MVRSKLEYAQNVWSPYKMKYIERLENVERRATKLLPNHSKMSHEDTRSPAVVGMADSWHVKSI